MCKPGWPAILEEYDKTYGKQKDKQVHSVVGEYHSEDDSSADEDDS